MVGQSNVQIRVTSLQTRQGHDLITPKWFKWNAPPAGSRPITPKAGAVVGLLVGIALIAFQKIILGSVAIALAVIIAVASVVSAAFAGKLESVFERVGTWAAHVVSWLLLAPLFVLAFPIARLWHVVTRQDPLQLSDADEPTYWLPADAHDRKIRHAAAMFATHRVGRRSVGVPAVIGLAVLGVVIAEGTLRVKGFGKPILYVADPQIGFYPKPNQVTKRQGGLIEINAFGMRAPQYSREKPEGVFRVLMLGDSTLYGGSYVDQSELYSRRVEEHLRNAAAGRRVEVLAMGVNAWGPFHGLGYVEKFGTFDADLAIIALPTGDIYRPLYGLEAVPFLSAQTPPRLALEEVANHLAWRLRTKQIGPLSPDQLKWHSEHGLQAYARLARLLSERGAEVMFEILPSETAAVGDVDPRERRDAERIEARVRSAGAFRVAYPAGFFRNAKGRLYHDGVHLHVDGHRLYAEYLRDRITRFSVRWNEWIESPRERDAGVTR